MKLFVHLRENVNYRSIGADFGRPGEVCAFVQLHTLRSGQHSSEAQSGASCSSGGHFENRKKCPCKQLGNAKVVRVVCACVCARACACLLVVISRSCACPLFT